MGKRIPYVFIGKDLLRDAGRRIVSVCLCAWTLCIPAARGQEAAGAAVPPGTVLREQTIPTVEVSARRPLRGEAVARTEIDSSRLSLSVTQSFAELLSNHSSVYVQTYGMGSLATVKFRGAAASHTQVDWNGMRINNPMIGQVDFSLLPVWFVDRVTLYHGGNSLGTGSGALGGVVAAGSAARWDKKLYGTALQSVGSFGAYQTFAMLGGGGRTVQARVRYLYEEADNDFEYLKNQYGLAAQKVRQEHAEYQKQGAVGDLWWNAGRGHLLSLHLWYLHADRNLPVHTYYYGSGRRETQRDGEFRAVFHWKKYGERYRSEWMTGIASTRLDYRKEDFTMLGVWWVDEDSRSGFRSLYNKYRFEYSLSARTTLEAVANGDFHRARIEHVRMEASEPGRYSRGEFGLSATLRHRFSDAFSGYLLLREDAVGGDFSPLMPALGLEYRPWRDDRLRIVLNAARNYHHPTLNDLYWVPGGNPDLAPEESRTADLSAIGALKTGGWSFEGSVTGYVSRGRDWIVWVPRGGGNLSYIYTAQNVAKVLSRGVETAWNIGYAQRDWHAALGGNYAYTCTTNESSRALSGRQLPDIPRHKANLTLDVRRRGWYGMWLWAYIGKRSKSTALDSPLNTLDAYALHGVTLGKQLTVWKCGVDLRGTVKNLFATRYEPMAGRAVPGRNYQLMAKITF